MNTCKRYIFQGLFFVMAALASASAIATVLEGEINSHDGNAKVTLTVNLQSNPGDTAGKLKYGPPFDCALNVVTRGGGDNEKQVFSLALPDGLMSTEETGPTCTGLVNIGAYVELTPGGAGWVTISVNDSQNRLKQRGELKKTSD